AAMVAIVGIAILAVTHRRVVAIFPRVLAALLQPFAISAVERLPLNVTPASGIRITSVPAVAVCLSARRSRREQCDERAGRQESFRHGVHLVTHQKINPCATAFRGIYWNKTLGPRKAPVVLSTRGDGLDGWERWDGWEMGAMGATREMGATGSSGRWKGARSRRDVTEGRKRDVRGIGMTGEPSDGLS